ncbi:MAG: DNA polymerase III subunit [Arcticibacter sp.]
MRFSEVIGLQEVKERLASAVMEDRVSHAQLFSGHKGSHGLAMALAYASFLMCENRNHDDSCGACPACIKNDKLVHPDLHFSFPSVTTSEVKEKPKSIHFIDKWRSAVLENPYLSLDDWYDHLGVGNKQGFMSVEEANDIMRKLSLKTYESSFKILIMWMPEKMRVDAANKLLKTLEEPPSGSVFILVTEDGTALLPTIRSRTQLVRIPVPEPRLLAEHLVRTYNIDSVKAERIVRIVDGQVAPAISMASVGPDEIGTPMEHEFIHWMRLCYMPFYAKDGTYAWSDLNDWIDETNKKGKEHIKRFLTFCSDASRECMLLSVGAGNLVRFDDSVIPGFGKFSRFIHSGNVEAIMELLGKASYAVERNANPRILLLDLSFKLNVLLNPRSS